MILIVYEKEGREGEGRSGREGGKRGKGSQLPWGLLLLASLDLGERIEREMDGNGRR